MGWGATVGHLSDRDRVDFPGLGECDLVIHVCPASTDPGAMPDGAQAAGGAARAAAPLLVLGGPAEVGGAFAAVPDIGPGGIRLRAALAGCLAHGTKLRAGNGGDLRQEHLQFLGHELRSPLAAIKTALDVLSREGGFDVGGGRMLDIAARNVDRLTATVEWSQDLRELDETPPAVRLDEVTLGEVVLGLEDAGWTVITTADSSRVVLTDPGLLGQLVGQLGRVMSSAYPQEGRRLFLDNADDGEGIRVALLTDVEDRPVAGLQAGRPWGLEVQFDESESAVQRLIDVVIAPYLREVLGVRPRALETSSGLRGVGFDLPLPLPVTTS